MSIKALVTAAFLLTLPFSCTNTVAYHRADIAIRDRIVTVQRQVANSTSIDLAEKNLTVLVNNLEEFDFPPHLALTSWNQNNLDYSFEAYEERVKEALRMAREATPEERAEVLRNIQDGFTNTTGSVSIPYGLAGHYRWGSNYTVGKLWYDGFFNILTIFLGGCIVFIVWCLDS
jgi:hypothetical protein